MLKQVHDIIIAGETFTLNEEQILRLMDLLSENGLDIDTVSLEDVKPYLVAVKI